MQHAVQDPATGLHRLLVCRVLVGNAMLTRQGDRGPKDEDFDSGGDGAGNWIILSHADSQVFFVCILLLLYAIA